MIVEWAFYSRLAGNSTRIRHFFFVHQPNPFAIAMASVGA
jgi:hypothetical protein